MSYYSKYKLILNKEDYLKLIDDHKLNAFLENDPKVLETPDETYYLLEAEVDDIDGIFPKNVFDFIEGKKYCFSRIGESYDDVPDVRYSATDFEGSYDQEFEQFFQGLDIVVDDSFVIANEISQERKEQLAKNLTVKAYETLDLTADEILGVYISKNSFRDIFFIVSEKASPMEKEEFIDYLTEEVGFTDKEVEILDDMNRNLLIDFPEFIERDK